MADDYLGKKMEEYHSRPQTIHKPIATLARLLLKNRSHRSYDNSFTVREDQLKKIIEVNRRIPSALNRQALRFRPVLTDEADKMLPFIRLGGALPDLHLPPKGQEPRAYIIICANVAEDRWIDIELGISAQSMLLQAAEMGLNGICIGAFDRKGVQEAFNLKYEPLMLLAIGRGAEDIRLVDIAEGDDHTYYRQNGIHYVPKVRLEDLIL